MLTGLGASKLILDLNNVANWDEIVAMVGAAVAEYERLQREVFPDLRRVEVELDRQGLRRDCANPRILELVETAEIHGQPVRGQLFPVL